MARARATRASRCPDGRWTSGGELTARRSGGTALSSPIGLRLPLESLAWSPPPAEPDRSPFEPRPALAEVRRAATPALVVAAEQAPTTALCVEVRDGRLHVFLPPLTRLDDAIELLDV